VLRILHISEKLAGKASVRKHDLGKGRRFMRVGIEFDPRDTISGVDTQLQEQIRMLA
jgi:hypothetical protein